MAKGRTNWRNKCVEACALVARAISVTDSGAAHTVQLIMRDPSARASAINDALQRTSPTTDPEGYKKLQAAVDLLRGYEGRVI